MTNDDGRFPESRLHTRDGTVSRRSLLRACAAALCLTGLPALLAGCAKPKAGRGGGDGPTAREPQAHGGSRAVGEKVEVRVGAGATVGVLDAAEGATGAVLMVGGMAGGLGGPSGVYPKLAGRSRKSGITALRLDYREPGDLISCTEDVLAALGALGRGSTKEAVIVGWSFGGAVAIRAGGESDLVAGVATVSSQTGGTEEVKKLAPEKSLLLIHGTNDTTVVPSLARYLYRNAAEPKELVFYEGDGHSIEIHTEAMMQKIYAFATKLLSDGASRDARRRQIPRSSEHTLGDTG